MSRPNSTISTSSLKIFTCKVKSKIKNSVFYSHMAILYTGQFPCPISTQKGEGKSLSCYSSGLGANGNVCVLGVGRHNLKKKKTRTNSGLKFQKDTQAVVHVLKRFLISKEPRLYQLMDKVDLHTMNQGSPIFHWQEKKRWLIRKGYRLCHRPTKEEYIH